MKRLVFMLQWNVQMSLLGTIIFYVLKSLYLFTLLSDILLRGIFRGWDSLSKSTNLLLNQGWIWVYSAFSSAHLWEWKTQYLPEFSATFFDLRCANSFATIAFESLVEISPWGTRLLCLVVNNIVNSVILTSPIKS